MRPWPLVTCFVGPSGCLDMWGDHRLRAGGTAAVDLTTQVPPDAVHLGPRSQGWQLNLTQFPAHLILGASIAANLVTSGS